MSDSTIKYYIILQPSIRAMGGEEMYTRNIAISAQEKGYTPLVLHAGIGDVIYIDDLKRFNKYEFPEFRYEPCVVSRKRKNRLLNRLKHILNDFDKDSIIESHEILVAEWGEWIASQFGLRHFAFMLLEHNIISFRPLYEFFRYKYDRHELVGIVKNTIPDMFKHFGNNNVIGLFLQAHCNNVIEDIPCPDMFKLPPADYTIGTIGRTNKRYVQPMIDSIIRFVSKYKGKSFNILYIGGSMDKSSEKLVVKRLSSLPNVTLFFTGMIFPLSVEMLRQLNVCIASAGSCEASFLCGVPTISVDGNDSKAIGVFNKTTKHSLFRDTTEKPIEIEELLERVLIKEEFQLEEKIKMVMPDFSSHWDFVNKMSQEREYFDIDGIYYPFKKRQLSRFLGFYYGLKPSSLAHRILEKGIGFMRK